jgi:hypothetical protein
MNADEKHCHRVGPGGYKCRCCGPAPSARKKYRRAVRARLKTLDRKRYLMLAVAALEGDV